MPGTEAPLPMFPLGTVLLPTAVLPLHIFEPRYRALVTDCLDAEREFGVTLIERGSEVGGGETRTDVGTIAQIVEAEESPDGRWLITAVGTRRIRVAEWLPDGPYPRARIEDWPERTPNGDLGVQRSASLELLTELATCAAQLGVENAGELPEIAVDPVLASYQMSAVAPVGPLDRQLLLRAPGPEERLTLLVELLGESLVDLKLRLDLEGR
jgi:Lon protease-like protein